MKVTNAPVYIMPSKRKILLVTNIFYISEKSFYTLHHYIKPINYNEYVALYVTKYMMC